MRFIAAFTATLVGVVGFALLTLCAAFYGTEVVYPILRVPLASDLAATGRGIASGFVTFFTWAFTVYALAHLIAGLANPEDEDQDQGQGE